MDGIAVHKLHPDTGLYYRSQEGDDISPTTVGSLDHECCGDDGQYLQSPIDERTPDAQVLGSNPVYVFTGGTVRVGSWLRFRPQIRSSSSTTSTTQPDRAPARPNLGQLLQHHGTLSWGGEC
jgi:hypothetical protein